MGAVAGKGRLGSVCFGCVLSVNLKMSTDRNFCSMELLRGV